MFTLLIYTVPPLPTPLRLTVQGDGKHNVTFKWVYSVPPKAKLHEIRFGATDEKGNYMVVMGKRFRKGKIYIWYSAESPEVVRKFNPRGVLQNSYSSNLKVLETRLPTTHDTIAAFTLTNVLMKDTGVYYCDVVFADFYGRTFQNRAYLDVIPGKLSHYEIFPLAEY